jgi:hypothetical protein
VAGNGFVCGAFTPVSWPADAATRDGFVADPSGRTCLFSLVNAHGRPVKLRLKAAHRKKALSMKGGGCGPGFGGAADLRLMRLGIAANQPRGCVTQPNSFELDQEAEAAAGLPSIPFVHDKKLLGSAHDQSGDRAFFDAAEIEVYQL